MTHIIFTKMKGKLVEGGTFEYKSTDQKVYIPREVLLTAIIIQEAENCFWIKDEKSGFIAYVKEDPGEIAMGLQEEDLIDARKAN